MKIIDFRLRPPYGDYCTSFFFNHDVMANYLRQTRMEQAESALECSMEKCVAEMAATGTEIGVCQARPDLNVSNQTIADIVTKYPAHFVGCIDLDIYNMQEAFNDIDKFIIDGPCSGVSLAPAWLKNSPAVPFDDGRLYPIFDKCQKNGIFVIYTTGMSFDKLENVNPYILDHVALDFPEMTIIVSHAGWPFVLETCAIAHARKNVYLSPDQYIFNTPGYRDYVTAINNMLQDKMLYASCYPLVSLKSAIDYTLTLGINELALSKYMYENAAKILNLPK